MIRNREKLGQAITFEKYLASVDFLVFLQESFIWNKIAFPASSFLNLSELLINDLKMNISENIFLFIFLFDLSLLNVKVLGA